MTIRISLMGHDLLMLPGTSEDAALLSNLAFVKMQETRGKRTYRAVPGDFYQLQKYRPDIAFGEHKLWTAIIDARLEQSPRDYQQEAFTKWEENKFRGIVVLPTGTGKTLLGLMAISKLKCSTLVVVPTIDLLHQWKDSIERNLGVKNVAILGGGHKEISGVTVTTYDSAIIHVRRLALFKLLIFDEVHHLPTENNSLIADGIIAPYRLGLSATPERVDELHKRLPGLVGPVVYRKGHADLKPYIADFKLQRLDIGLSDEETQRYIENMKCYRSYVFRKKLFYFGKNAYQQLIFRVGKDPYARKALLAHQEARKTALNAAKKLDIVEELLAKHKEEKVIIFSEFNSIVDEISERFLMPSITHRTKPGERKEILGLFKEGSFTKIVTGRVLDEGVDVPDASVGIIVSGSASERAYIQRLGRIIRPMENKEAILYELVTKRTLEGSSSYRRKRGVEEVKGSCPP